MVRVIADRLGGVRTVDGLVDAYADWQAVASAALGERPVDMLGMDLELTAGAAFYLRHQELTSELRRQEAVDAIALARERGDEWVVVHQSSSPTGLPYPPWRRLEMHLPDGAAIHQWVEQSLEGADVEFGVEVVALDPETGRWLDDRPARDREVTSSYEQWLDSVERLKARAGTGGVETPAERGA